MKDLYIIDGMALAYRGHFAFIRNPLRSKSGQPTSAIYSFLSTLQRIIRDKKAEQLAVVFDSDKDTFRHRLYPEYKAHRPPMPDDLKSQIPMILQLLETMHIPVLRLPGIEADDVIGTLAVKAASSGGHAYIVSRDKDFGQLVSEHIHMVDPGNQNDGLSIMAAPEIEAKFGVPPDKIVDYLALIGDASDNIPGVDKVGPKTAVELIKTYGNLDGIYRNIENIKQKGLKANLERCRDMAYLSQTLVILKTDLTLPQEEFSFGPIDSTRFAAFCKELDFYQFLKDNLPVAAAEGEKSGSYETLDSTASLARFLQLGATTTVLALDTETDGLDPNNATLVGLSLCHTVGKAGYVPIAHQSGRNLPLMEVRSILTDHLAKTKPLVVGHHLKFDLAVLRHHQFELNGPFFDTMVAAYLLNPGVRRYSLSDCAMNALSLAKQPITELIGDKGKNQLPFSSVPIDKATAYSGQDADLALRLKEVFESDLRKNGLLDLFRDMEMALIPVLLDMEKNGIRIDAPFLKNLSADYDADLAKLHQTIVTAAGREFNLNSPKQLAEILFDELNIKPLRKLKTGYSTDADVLEVLARDHELPRLILKYRELQKLKSTYVDALPAVMDQQGLVHSSFNQTVTATGRLSSSDPNLQNIPVRTEMGREIRKAFIPRTEGHVILSADYSQIELRILAHLSGEEALITAFREGADIHTRTAALIFGMIPEMVTPDQRRMAKTVNFGIVYGQGAYGLSQQLSIPQGEAKAFIDGYFTTYPGIRRYMDQSIESAREKGYAETLYGRRRPLLEINSSQHNLRSFAERMAMNTPIQGSAADLIKVAMIRVHQEIRDGQIRATLLLQVHDELVFECSKVESTQVAEYIRRIMEQSATWRVPLKVDVGMGANWLEAH